MVSPVVIEPERSEYRRGYLYLVCAIASLGGVLFGYDMVIISGAVPYFSQYYHLSEAGIGWAVGCINLGAALGALIAGRLTDGLGRKKLLLLCALLFAVTGIGTGWAANAGLFIVFRLLSGVAVGVAALVCPMYIAEVSPAGFRGRMVTFYQLAIVSGLLLAYLSDYLLLNSGVNNWRWMFTSQSIPALLFFSGLFLVAESPRWLCGKQQTARAVQILTRIGGTAYAERQVGIIQNSFRQEEKGHWKDMFHKKYRRILLVGVAIAVFSQADGQNSLFSYAPEIFRQAGMARDSAFMQSVILGLINFVCTFAAIGTIDRTGRRKLLLTGSALLCLDALALAAAFAFHLSSSWILGFVLGFIAIYAGTLGPVTWVALSELFPNKIRGSLMGLATLSLWIANFFTIASFPILKAHWGLPGTFGIHAAVCLAYFLFIYRKVPETKGKSLEEIEAALITLE